MDLWRQCMLGSRLDGWFSVRLFMTVLMWELWPTSLTVVKNQLFIHRSASELDSRSVTVVCFAQQNRFHNRLTVSIWAVKVRGLGLLLSITISIICDYCCHWQSLLKLSNASIFHQLYFVLHFWLCINYSGSQFFILCTLFQIYSMLLRYGAIEITIIIKG